MATAPVATPHAEDRSVLREITWDTYVQLCDENQSHATQMAYFEGILEIMTVGLLHESAGELLRLMFYAMAESLRVRFRGTGQTTFRHATKGIGFEADLSYYVSNLSHVRARSNLDLIKDPPPDLVIEIDISRNSQRKLLMYGALGIREVWRYEGAELCVYSFNGHEYDRAATSSVLPGVQVVLMNKLLADAESMDELDWIAHVRQSVAAPPAATTSA
jgi:Uma2 family endonuclease